MKKQVSRFFQTDSKRHLRLIAALLIIGTLLCTAACNGGSKKGNETDPVTEGDTPMEIPTEFSLLAHGGFVLQGTNLTANYIADSNVFDFSKRIEVARGVTWTISTDEAGENVIDGKAVTLTDGENRYYVNVKFRKETISYSTTIHYRSAYTVQFYSGCSAYVEPQTVDKGATLNKPTDPSREGYTFLGWYLDGEKFDFTNPPTEDLVLIAHWSKNDTSNKARDTSDPSFEGINAALHIVWKDYADCNALRPTEVNCILTQSYGSEKKEYEIVLSRDNAIWKNPLRAPVGSMLTQGDGGAWTLSLTNLPEKVDSKFCSYTLTQVSLNENYTTQQSDTEVINTVKGYVASVDQTAKLTTRNGRLYDAAGNMIVLRGVVTLNVGRKGADTTLSIDALKKLQAIGCNGLRLTAQLIGSSDTAGDGYVYFSNGQSSRTGDYNDSNARRMTELGKQNMLRQIDETIATATEAGLYIIIDWGILTSNPYQYINEASEFFGILSSKYADNPYVLFEICNEPKSTWGYKNGKENSIKAYGEEIISLIRANGSNAIVVLSPNESATRLSDVGFDDPISDPLSDDIAFNVAYTFHCYPYNYSYGNSQYKYGWRLRDAHNAGLTVITTEFSPMDGTFDSPDTLSYDMEEAAKYIRMFQEWDISYFYFRYESPVSTDTTYYHENSMFIPNLNLTIRQWTVDDLTGCGRWYYNLLTGDGLFLEADYTTVQKKNYRKNFDSIHSAYGLGATFPGFALDAEVDGNTCAYIVGDLEDLSDAQFKAYAVLLWKRIQRVASNGEIKTPSGATFTADMLPKTIYESMELTYVYNGKTISFSLSYGLNSTGSAYGTILVIK